VGAASASATSQERGSSRGCRLDDENLICEAIYQHQHHADSTTEYTHDVYAIEIDLVDISMPITHLLSKYARKPGLDVAEAFHARTQFSQHQNDIVWSYLGDNTSRDTIGVCRWSCSW
jgi:hypothetical protein